MDAGALLLQIPADAAAVCALTVLPVAFAAWLVRRRVGRADVHKRGALVLHGRAVKRERGRIRRSGGWQAAEVTLAGVPLTLKDETKHFKLIGSTGTGKSTAIRELIATAIGRGDRLVIADPDGLYRARFYRRYRGDVILNPFEPNSPRWNPFAEIREPYDVELLSSALVPSSEDTSGREWRGYARTFLTALLRRSHERQQTDLAELWRLLALAQVGELRALLAGTPAQPFLEPDNLRMFSSIRSVATSAAAALEHIERQRAAPFSVRQWIRHGHGVLFMPYSARQIAALRTIVALWLRLAIFEALSQGEGDQRLWFIVDELDALGQIDGLKDALARLRKFGGRCVLGIQSVAQVSSTYGAGDAQTIVENCGNTLILRCSASEHGGTSQFAARLIGEREVSRRQLTQGRDQDGAFARAPRSSWQRSSQRVIEAAVMPAEIEQLPDLAGYLKTASSRAWLRVALSPLPG